MASKYSDYHAKVEAIAIARINYEDGALSIHGIDVNNNVVFDANFSDIACVRASDESMRLRVIKDLGDKRGLIVVDNDSDLLKWLSAEDLETRSWENAKHFLFLVGEEIIDVVSFSEPKIMRV